MLGKHLEPIRLHTRVHLARVNFSIHKQFVMYLERVTEKQKKDANIRRAHHNVHVIIVWVAYKQRRTIRVSASSSSDVKSSIDIAESWVPSGL